MAMPHYHTNTLFSATDLRATASQLFTAENLEGSCRWLIFQECLMMDRQICWEAGAHRLFADWMGSILLLLCTMKQVKPPFFPSLVPQLHPKGWILLSQYSLFQFMALPSWAFQTGDWGMSSSLLCPSSLHPDDGPVYKHFSVTFCPFVPISWVLLKQVILFHPEVAVPSRRQLSFKSIPFYTPHENGHPRIWLGLAHNLIMSTSPKALPASASQQQGEGILV